MIRQHPRSTGTDTLVPSATLFRSGSSARRRREEQPRPQRGERSSAVSWTPNPSRRDADSAFGEHCSGDRPVTLFVDCANCLTHGTVGEGAAQIGRAHVWTPVPIAHLVCRFPPGKKNTDTLTI